MVPPWSCGWWVRCGLWFLSIWLSCPFEPVVWVSGLVSLVHVGGAWWRGLAGGGRSGCGLPSTLRDVSAMSSSVVGRVRTLRHQDFRRVWVSGAVSGAGDWIGLLALTLVVLEQTSSAGWAGAVVAAMTVPAVGPGQLLTSWLERMMSRRLILVVTDVVRAGVVVVAGVGVAAGWLGPFGVVVVAALVGLVSSPFDAVRAAVTPDTVPDDEYGLAVALTNMTYQLMVLVGYAVGGALVVWLGAAGALWVDAGTYVVSAVLLARLQAGRGRTVVEAKPLRAAVRVMWQSGALRWTLVVLAASVLLRGLTSLAPAVATESLDVGAAGAGWLAAAVGLGSLVAAAVVPAEGSSSRLLRAGSVLVVGSSVVAAVLMFVGGGWAAGLAMVVAGVGLAASVPLSTVFGSVLPPAQRAAGFAVAFGVLRAMSALAPAVAGPVADVAQSSGWPAFGVSTAVVLVPAVVVGVWGWWRWRCGSDRGGQLAAADEVAAD